MKIARREQNIILFQNFSVNSKAEEYTLDPYFIKYIHSISNIGMNTL